MAKATKRFIPALFALLMVFAFMPSMAFATEHPAKEVKEWGNMYSTVTDVDGTTFDTNRAFETSGLITATPADKEATVVGGDSYKAPATTAYYYDLEGSQFVYADGKKLDGTTWTQAEFEKLLNGTTTLGVQLVEPTYTKAYQDAQKAGTAYTLKKAQKNLTITDLTTTEGTATFGYWTMLVNKVEYTSGSEQDQTVTISVKSITPAEDKVIDGTSYADLFGTVASATITVQGLAKTPATAGFYLDTVGGTAYNAGVYDGAAHTVVADATPGWTVSYMVKNPATGKFEAANAVTITDHQETPISFYAVFKDEKQKQPDVKTATMSLNLAATSTSRAINVGWDATKSEADGGVFFYTVPGAEYNAADYVAFKATEQDKVTGETAEQAAARIAANEGAKKAVEANSALLKEYFNDRYEVKDVTTKAAASENQVILSIAEKTLSADETKAFNTKYAQLQANLGTITVATGNATIQLNGDLIDYEVEFTDTPTVMTYKAKKLKKKAASFTVTAVANNNATVNYKLIDAPQKIVIDKTTGKITLKKGLKKGTYKIKVKAYVPGKSLTAFETQAIKIKVKK